ncbi:isochorismatase family protein [Alcaligenaceae bacterium A4P071]|nr:isochorismatase family protein [Alcaligenaceae bacterium B3P038]MDQ2185739.1 isochorismatase family protein [Alcaligenaceae bacterium A4P071]
MDSYTERSFGAIERGVTGKIGIAVVDFQLAFTDARFPMGGAALVERAVINSARLLEVARANNIPVVSCYTAYNNPREIPPWKIRELHESFSIGDPGNALDPRIEDTAYDVILRKTAPSIFFQTSAALVFTKAAVETVVIVGCNTSGCVRASVNDAFSHGFHVVVPEDCSGDVEEGPHRDNLRDVGRRYADIMMADDIIDAILTNRALQRSVA